MSDGRIKVWPREGLKIRDEYSMQHIEPGQEVVDSPLTRKRLRDGDLLDEAGFVASKRPKNALREAFPDQRRGARGVRGDAKPEQPAEQPAPFQPTNPEDPRDLRAEARDPEQREAFNTDKSEG